MNCRLVDVSMDKLQPESIHSLDVLCDESGASDGRMKLPVKRKIKAALYIDASYDGDVMVGTRSIEYVAGREGTAVYNESLAGVQELGEPLESFHGLKVLATASDTNNTLIPYVFFQNVTSLPKPGTADDKLMAFQHRAVSFVSSVCFLISLIASLTLCNYLQCVTTDKDNRVPFPRPKGYNRKDFLLLQRLLDALPGSKAPPFSYFTDLGHYSQEVFNVANKKKYIICCGSGPVDSDQPNINAGWAKANHTAKQEIIDKHTYYLQGSFYYLANDLAVPQFTRNDTSRYGLCKDEFVDFDNWPPQLYIRSSNRLRGMVVMTQNNLATHAARKRQLRWVAGNLISTQWQGMEYWTRKMGCVML